MAVLVGLLCLVWGSTWLVIKGGLRDLPPLTSAAARMAIAAAAMFPLVALLARREGGASPPFWLSFACGTLNFTGSYSVVYVAEQTLPSGLASVIFAIFPLLVALLAHVYLPGERLRPGAAIGFVLAFCGVASLFWTDLAALGEGAAPAAAFLLLSPLVSAIGSVVVKRHGAAISSLRLNRDALVVGALQLTVLALVFERDREARFTPAAWGSVLYLALLGTVFTFCTWFWLLRFVKASKLAVVPYVTPGVALVLGASVGGEPIGAGAVLGLAAILAGVFLATRRGGRRAA